ncbi:MAG: prepilin-type N-terminal cleavage/methylation domain-containing protein [bacterium]
MMKELNNRGFTLLELMISMSVLAVALMGILPFFFYAQAQITQATITNIAMSLLQQKLNRITQLDYDLIHYMDAPFYPDVATQYLYILPEVNDSPCRDYPSNPCGFKPACNCLVDIAIVDGYHFTRTIDIDDPLDFDSIEFAQDRQFGTTTHLYLPNFDTKGITVEVRWTVPGGKERYVRSTTLVYNNIDFPF